MTPESIQQRFGIKVLSSSDPSIRHIKKHNDQTQLHGNKIWKASYVLMDYLLESPLPDQVRVLELGCGWGLGSIFCQRQFHSSPVALDADDAVFPCLEAMALSNGVELPHVQMKFADITEDQLANFDVLIGADICFWDELADELLQLLGRALDAGVSRIVLSDPGRPPFRSMAELLCDAEGIEVTYTDWVVPEPFNQWGLILDIRLSDAAQL